MKKLFEFLFNYYVCYNIIGEESSNRLTDIVNKYAAKINRDCSETTITMFIDELRRKLPSENMFINAFLFMNQSVRNRNDALADAITAINHFDLILFLEPTVAFVQDGTRNEKLLTDREGFSQQIKDLFDEAGLKYHCISGDYEQRFFASKELIRKNFGI